MCDVLLAYHIVICLRQVGNLKCPALQLLYNMVYSEHRVTNILVKCLFPNRLSSSTDSWEPKCTNVNPRADQGGCPWKSPHPHLHLCQNPLYSPTPQNSKTQTIIYLTHLENTNTPGVGSLSFQNGTIVRLPGAGCQKGVKIPWIGHSLEIHTDLYLYILIPMDDPKSG